MSFNLEPGMLLAFLAGAIGGATIHVVILLIALWRTR